jgi:hypothetical protein
MPVSASFCERGMREVYDTAGWRVEGIPAFRRRASRHEQRLALDPDK